MPIHTLIRMTRIRAEVAFPQKSKGTSRIPDLIRNPLIRPFLAKSFYMYIREIN